MTTRGNLPADSDAIVFRTVQDILSMSYFYSQHLDECVGALVYSANRMGKTLSKDEAVALIPALRAALTQFQTAGAP